MQTRERMHISSGWCCETPPPGGHRGGGGGGGDSWPSAECQVFCFGGALSAAAARPGRSGGGCPWSGHVLTGETVVSRQQPQPLHPQIVLPAANPTSVNGHYTP